MLKIIGIGFSSIVFGIYDIWFAYSHSNTNYGVPDLKEMLEVF